MVTVFQTVDAHDVLEVEGVGQSGPRGIDFRLLEGTAPTGRDNLVVQAAAAVLERWAPAGGVRLGLRKRLPVGGGLGGGSSNAATTLRAVSAALELDVTPEQLSSLARELGADVPYFLIGGTALGLGRGDLIEPLSPELPASEIWLLTPAEGVSTAEAFERWRREGAAQSPKALSDWRRGVAPERPWEVPWRNDLEPTVRAFCSAVDAVYTPAIRAGASCVRLSGSGSDGLRSLPERGGGGRVSKDRLPVGTEARRVKNSRPRTSTSPARSWRYRRSPQNEPSDAGHRGQGLSGIDEEKLKAFVSVVFDRLLHGERHQDHPG